MKFIELTDVDKLDSKVLINMNKIVFVRANHRKGIGLKPAAAIVYVENDEYIRVKETYEEIKEIIERTT